MLHFTDEQLDQLFFIAERAKASRFYRIANVVFAILLDEALGERDRFMLAWEVGSPHFQFQGYKDLLLIGWKHREICMPVVILQDHVAMETLRLCGLAGRVSEQKDRHERPYVAPYKGLTAELWRELFSVVGSSPESPFGTGWGAGWARQMVEDRLTDSHSFTIEQVLREIEVRSGIEPELRGFGIFPILRRWLEKAKILVADLDRRTYHWRRDRLQDRRARYYRALSQG